VQAARLASVTGRWAYTVTLAVYAYHWAGAGGVAVAGIVRLAPGALIAPFSGALTARGRTGAVLLRGGVVRTLGLAAAGALILTGAPIVAVYVLVAVESAASTLMRPLQNSLLPLLSRTPEELTSTTLALSVIESAGVLLGPLLGALLLHETSVGAVFEVAAAAYAVSALLLLPVRDTDAPIRPGPQRATLLAGALGGARAVAADREARVIVALYGAQNLAAGALNVLIVVSALEFLEMGQSGVGTLTAALGFGGVVGGGLVFARLRRGHYGADLRVGLLLWGVPLVLLALVSSTIAALILLVVVGVGVTVVDVSAVTLLQRNAEGEFLPQALGVLQSVFVASVGLGTLLAPLLVRSLGIRGALLATGLLLPLLAAALWPRLRRLDRGSGAESGLVSLLASIPIFAPLSEPAREQLALRLRAERYEPGETVFAQGDHGDGFYIVQAGEVDVVIDGDHVRTLGRHGYFGEIALLRDEPRTATVRARSAVRLQRLDRERFLAIVTGITATLAAADAVVDARLGLQTN
jgi:predicted MFS family arabinose efflux permease